MATVEFQSGSMTHLREGHNRIASGRNPQIKRLRVLSTGPNELEAALAYVVGSAPLLLRRPGMATRWKGQHRLAISM